MAIPTAAKTATKMNTIGNWSTPNSDKKREITVGLRIKLEEITKKI
jgi:hypothetical protein